MKAIGSRGFPDIFSEMFGDIGNKLDNVRNGLFQETTEIEGKDVYVSIAMPGIKKENISIDVEEHATERVLVISVKQSKNERKKVQGTSESQSSMISFRRVYDISDMEEAIDAEYTDGILTLHMTKLQEEPPKAPSRKIEIK